MTRSDEPPDPGSSLSGDGGLPSLFAGPPREVLRRLTDGDPLELLPRCSEHLRHEALLIDPMRLYWRVVARVARAGASYDGAAPLAPWISAIVKQSVRELLDEDVHEESAGYFVESGDERYAGQQCA